MAAPEKKMEVVPNQPAQSDVEKAILEKLKALKGAPPEKMTRVSDENFWKPRSKGDSIEGVYDSSKKVGTRIEHTAFCIDEKTGKMTTIRFNGSKAVNEGLDGAKGKYFKLVWNGKEQLPDGVRSFNHYDVFLEK